MQNSLLIVSLCIACFCAGVSLQYYVTEITAYLDSKMLGFQIWDLNETELDKRENANVFKLKFESRNDTSLYKSFKPVRDSFGVMAVGNKNSKLSFTSPDLKCIVNLQRLSNEDLDADFLLNLPIFYSEDELRSSEWFQYIDRLYGPLRSRDFPIDLRCFLFWWADFIPKSTKAAFSRHLNKNAPWKIGLKEEYGKFEGKKTVSAWRVDIYGPVAGSQIVDNNKNIIFTSGTRFEFKNFISTRSALKFTHGLPSNSWVEISHHGSDCVQDLLPVGYWSYLSPGSGIFFNLGRTMTFAGGYFHACRYFYGKNDPRCKLCCTPNHLIVFEAALKAGLDSLQFPYSAPGGQSSFTYEIMSLKSRCDSNQHIAPINELCGAYTAQKNKTKTVPKINDAGACPPGGLLRRGRDAHRKCVCLPSHQNVNCVENDRNIGIENVHICS